MKRLFRTLMIAILVVPVVFVLSACVTKEVLPDVIPDDGGGVAAPTTIIGTWCAEETDPTGDGFFSMTMTFNADGTLLATVNTEIIDLQNLVDNGQIEQEELDNILENAGEDYLSVVIELLGEEYAEVFGDFELSLDGTKLMMVATFVGTWEIDGDILTFSVTAFDETQTESGPFRISDDGNTLYLDCYCEDCDDECEDECNCGEEYTRVA